MTTKYNPIRYKELLEKSSIFTNQNKNLSEELITKTEIRELLSYRTVLLGQIQYYRKHIYIALIDKYLTNKINFNSFQVEFSSIFTRDYKTVKNIEKNFQVLSKISIDDSDSAEFNRLLEEILTACILYEDSELINELVFYNSLNKDLLSIKKIFDK